MISVISHCWSAGSPFIGALTCFTHHLKLPTSWPWVELPLGLARCRRHSHWPLRSSTRLAAHDGKAMLWQQGGYGMGRSLTCKICITGSLSCFRSRCGCQLHPKRKCAASFCHHPILVPKSCSEKGASLRLQRSCEKTGWGLLMYLQPLKFYFSSGWGLRMLLSEALGDHGHDFSGSGVLCFRQKGTGRPSPHCEVCRKMGYNHIPRLQVAID